MKETPISKSEKEFIIKSVQENQRLDGRQRDDFRQLRINFGAEYGSAHVSVGETRVMAQVSCELGQPKATRPNEGLLHINVELGPMAAPQFEAERYSELTIKTTRILERTFKDSKCVDLESLCVSADDKVWILRVDLNVLNHEGNIIDCASVATLCALAHFRRPDVTMSGREVKIHSFAEKDPVPTVLHHYPVCVSYATFQEGSTAIADPSQLEEKSCESNMIFGFNSYREVCCLNLGGTTFTCPQLLLNCSHRAADRAKIVVEQVRAALAEDAEIRKSGKSVGFAECLRLNKLTSLAEDKFVLKLKSFTFNFDEDAAMTENPDNCVEQKVVPINATTRTLGSNQSSVKWIPEADSECSDSEFDDNVTIEKPEADPTKQNEKLESAQKSKSKKAKRQEAKRKQSSSDSEEDAKMILG